MSTKMHVHLDVKGTILNFRAREWRNVRRVEGGQFLTPEEVKAFFLDELAKGHTALPFGDPCEGFSFTTGCPGHETPSVAPARPIVESSNEAAAPEPQERRAP